MLIGAFLLAGCGPGSPGASESRAAALEEMMGGEGASLERGLQRQDDIVAAITDCMLREGYELEDFAHLLITRETFEEQMQQRAGLDRVASEAGLSFEEYYGFGISTASLPVEFARYDLKTSRRSIDQGQNPPAVRSLPAPEVSRDFFGGDGRQGCFDSGMSEVEDAYPEMRYAQRIGAEVDARVEADGRLVEVEVVRDRCLAERGYDAPDIALPALQQEFVDLSSDAIASYTTDEGLPTSVVEDLARLQATEVDLAEAVLACDLEVGLREVAVEVRRQVYRELTTDPEFADIADEYLGSR